MALIVEIIEGSQKGTKYYLLEGKTFGRRKADYILKDPNVSGTHCRVEKDAGGALVLLDLDSSNGLVINSNKVRKIKLLPGVTFFVGDIEMRVKEIADDAALNLPTNKKWRDLLKDFVDDNPGTKKQTHSKISRFSPLLELEFLTGPQAEEKIILAFGPRQGGFGHLDILIEDVECPHLAFEISPLTPVGAEIRNRAGFKVLLNKKPLDRCELKNGDLLTVGRSIIRVTYL